MGFLISRGLDCTSNRSGDYILGLSAESGFGSLFQGFFEKVFSELTELIVHAREGHSIEERAHQIDSLMRVLAWYEMYLKW
jgi:hypothetical protein